MRRYAKKLVFGASMCVLGIALSTLFFAAGTDKLNIVLRQVQILIQPGSLKWRNGPPCRDESNVMPGQPKPYCGDLPSLAALNVREANLQEMARDFEYPWAFEFINSNELLVTEFSGKLKRLSIDTGESIDISGLPDIVPGKGQAGLLDVVLHPVFQKNQRVYLSYVISDSNDRYALAVSSAELRDDKLNNVEQIFVALPFGKNTSNFGGALAFDSSGHLLITTGDHTIRSNAQHPGLLTGKIIRLNTDGSIPDDNPFVGRGEAFNPSIYALGVRNPQGLVVDSLTGKIYETEHGPMGGDEINIIEAGENYGWPIITYGLNYTYQSIGQGFEKEGLKQPLFYYLPSIAISPVEIYRGEMFREWNGDLLVGALKGTAISKLDLVDGRIQSEYQILGEMNAKIRDIKVAPDSSIWILLEAGSIYRLSRETNPVRVQVEVGQRDGETIYLQFCSNCHSQSAPGAPQISNKSDWSDRLLKDRQELYRNSIEGFNGMPERGFCEDCTDKELRGAVDFMIYQLNEQ